MHRHDKHVLYILIIIVCITKYSSMYYLFDFVLSLPSNKPEILNEILKLFTHAY